MPRKRPLSFIILLLATLHLLVACQRNNQPPGSRKVRLSMIPATDPGKMLRDSKPLVDYLRKEMGAEVELTVPTDYAAVVEAIANEQVDIAHFGGFTYIQASKRAGVVPLVQREQDRNFHSVFITHSDSGINSLADLKGRTFSFGNVLSTSGHLMPEYFMRQNGTDRGVIDKAIYSGTHDGTALAVASKKVDAGALDEAIYQRMVSDGRLGSKVRVFYTTPPFLDYVWAAQPKFDSQLAEAFQAAFLKLDASKPDHKAILDFLGAAKYFRAEDADYNKLREAAIEAKLLP